MNSAPGHGDSLDMYIFYVSEINTIDIKVTHKEISRF